MHDSIERLFKFTHTECFWGESVQDRQSNLDLLSLSPFLEEIETLSNFIETNVQGVQVSLPCPHTCPVRIRRHAKPWYTSKGSTLILKLPTINRSTCLPFNSGPLHRKYNVFHVSLSAFDMVTYMPFKFPLLR